MKTSIHAEQDFEEFDGQFPSDVIMIHFKMVGVGANTLATADYLGPKLCQIVREQPGYFLMSQDGSDLREAMHDLVDRFCDAQEGRE
jgi:hypothetical protein